MARPLLCITPGNYKLKTSQSETKKRERSYHEKRCEIRYGCGFGCNGNS